MRGRAEKENKAKLSLFKSQGDFNTQDFFLIKKYPR